MKALGFCCFLLLLLRGAGRLAIVMGNGEIAEILFVLPPTQILSRISL